MVYAMGAEERISDTIIFYILWIIIIFSFFYAPYNLFVQYDDSFISFIITIIGAFVWWTLILLQ